MSEQLEATAREAIERAEKFRAEVSGEDFAQESSVPTAVDDVEILAHGVLELLEERERLRDLVGAARLVCQWLDRHEDDIAEWEDGAKLCINAMHRKIVELEDAPRASDSRGGLMPAKLVPDLVEVWVIRFELAPKPKKGSSGARLIALGPGAL